MDGEGQGAADTQDGAERGRTGTQMSLLTEELQGVALLLQRICLGVGGAVDFEGIGLYLTGLAFAHRLDQAAGDAQRRTGGDGLELLVGELGQVEHNLEIADRRTVVECHELHILVATAGAHPSFDTYFAAYQRRVEYIGYFGTFHCSFRSMFL